MIDTNAPHDLADGQYSTRRQACETVARAVGVEHLRDLLPEDLGFPELAAPEARRAREAAVEAALDRLREMPGLRDQVEPVVLTGWVRHVFTDMALVERPGPVHPALPRRSAASSRAGPGGLGGVREAVHHLPRLDAR
ncbi:hypothetical protein A5N15_03880 [Rothia kristinae]|uniref:Uncharacterized protein n=1 Tax=Rothia kristinae TaxID=37923 RepID=A0A657IV33_9MICC|nr:hypothetical protein A5N15_03880 [Rothia kristinae]